MHKGDTMDIFGLTLPSGRTILDTDFEFLRMMVRLGFIRLSDVPFPLRSGILSHVYVFGREDITDNIFFERQVGARIALTVDGFMQKAQETRQACLIGIPTAGTVLAQAAAMMSWDERREAATISHRTMREQPKRHGAHGDQWVNGRPALERHCYWLVDNVATDGESKVEAAERLIADGYPAKEMPVLILVDRQQGAVARLKREGFAHVIVMYNLLDLTYAFGELGLWPKGAVRGVEEEIRAHQR